MLTVVESSLHGRVLGINNYFHIRGGKNNWVHAHRPAEIKTSIIRVQKFVGMPPPALELYLYIFLRFRRTLNLLELLRSAAYILHLLSGAVYIIYVLTVCTLVLIFTESKIGIAQISKPACVSYLYILSLPCYNVNPCIIVFLSKTMHVVYT